MKPLFSNSDQGLKILLSVLFRFGLEDSLQTLILRLRTVESGSGFRVDEIHGLMAIIHGINPLTLTP